MKKGGDLADQRRRRHLAAGHAVDRVVDEDDGDVLAALFLRENYILMEKYHSKKQKSLLSHLAKTIKTMLCLRTEKNCFFTLIKGNTR